MDRVFWKKGARRGSLPRTAKPILSAGVDPPIGEGVLPNRYAPAYER